jgi:hypothetical protein
MSEDSSGTLAAIAGVLVDAVRPLEDAFRDEEQFRVLMLSLGWDAPGLPPSYLTVADAAAAVVEAFDALPDDASAADWLGLLSTAGDVYRAIEGLTEAPTGLDPAAFLPELARRLFEYLLEGVLRRRVPQLHSTLELLGVIRKQAHTGEGDSPPFTQVHIDWEVIPARLTDPGSLPKLLWGWGTDDLRLAPVFEVLAELADTLDLAAAVQQLTDAEAAHIQDGAAAPPARPARDALIVLLADPQVAGQRLPLGFRITELPPEGDAAAGLALQPIVPSELDARVPLGGGWVVVVRARTDLGSQFAVVVRPEELLVRYPGAPGQPLPSAGFGVALELGGQNQTPRLVFGEPEQTRLELTGASIAVTLDSHQGDLELTIAAEVSGLALVVSAAGADGFLGSVLGTQELRVDVPFSFAWSSRTGLRLKTQAGFEVSAHPDADFGFLRIDRLDLALRLAAGDTTPPALLLRAAAAFSGSLGPFSYAVDRFGVELPVVFQPGNAGPFDVQLRPTWPTGLGLAIDTPAVSGGGFLTLDPEAGRYAGVFELTIVDTVSVKVIGIVTTKLPDGRPGFALLLIITADGFTPVQLGMGFVLTGVGGLIALNRTIDVEAVRGGLSSGVLDSVLFATDPVKNAERIIGMLETIFPLAPDRLLIGPLAEIGWGSPTVVKIRLALLLEIPQPLRAVLLAALALVLPDPDEPVVELHVDAIGVLDLSRGELALDASLHHSRLYKFTLTGDMALRLNWGSDPVFLLSVGGFHPRFTPPPGLRRLERITFSLSDSDNPRIRFETYLALTSNTIQLGARVSVRAEAGGFGVDGGGAFDALVQWSPFGLDVLMEAWVRVFSPAGTLFGARLSLEVTGPQPWHVSGVIRFEVLWFSVEAGVDFTVGDPLAPIAQEAVDLVDLLFRELARPQSWSAALAADVAPGVTLGVAGADGAAPGPPLVHPLAQLSVRQKVVPLGTPISRVGANRPAAGTRRYDVDADFGAGHPLTSEALALTAVPLLDHFAPAQFVALTEDEKLTAPSFALMQAGLTFAPDQSRGTPLGRVLTTGLRFETLELDRLDAPAVRREVVPS